MEFAKDNFLKHAIGTQLNDPPIVITLENARANMANDAASISYLGTQGNLAVGMAFNAATESIKLMDTEFQLSEFRKFNLQGTISKLSGIYSLLGHTATDSMLILKGLTLMQYQSLSNRDPNNIRGIAVKQKENANADGVSDEIKSLSKLLYSIYVKPFESIIKDKKKLVICPDFILQIIPFETLIMPDGRYMGEVFDITYTPGFTISNMLSLRAYNTSGNIIAFGNPDYTTYHPEKLSGRALDYSFLGIKSWNELPGTEKELTAIRSQSNVMETKTGNNLSETSLKRMSKNGTLQKASILHFALHGIAGPASSKEDNSLVVTEPEGGIEDGLFQFSEALNLDMNAEFVCLSACESGINQIEDDGSMLTMATAFLAAGAKAVLATNWSIDDAATALFIKDVYTQVREQKIPFAAAVANTKRKFIKGNFGEKYKQPLYWAPFKYYGN
jgi:CHAT domain-containing protein